MDSFEWNKIFGAFLGSLLLIFVGREVTSFLFYEEPLEELAAMREVAAEAEAHGAATQKEEPKEASIGERMATLNSRTSSRPKM